MVCTVAAAAHCRGQRGRFRPGQKSRHAGESQNAYSLCELVHYPIVVWNEKNRRTIKTKCCTASIRVSLVSLC